MIKTYAIKGPKGNILEHTIRHEKYNADYVASKLGNEVDIPKELQ